MTIVLGMNCMEGTVLCSDSLDSDGITKTMENKIWSYQTQGQWGIAVGSAGESDFCEAFTDTLRELFVGEVYDREGIMRELRNAINAARVTYPDLEWAALFAMFGPHNPKAPTRQLLRVSDRSKHLAPVARFDAVGIGSHLAKFLCKQIYTDFMTLEETVHLAIYIVSQCIAHVAGCDGPISVVEWKMGRPEWRPYAPQQVKAIQNSFDTEKLRNALIDFWRSQTPGFIRNVPQYVSLPKGGSVKFLSAVGLQNNLANRKPKRSKK